jgi:MarR family transcriptional regulator, negative regulator of the multidrug operon emrRAB
MFLVFNSRMTGAVTNRRFWPLAANPGMISASSTVDHHPQHNMCATHMSVKLIFVRSAHIIQPMATEPEIANLLGALSLAVMDQIEQGARDIIGRAGETPAALIVIGYGPITNDKLRRILGLSHSGTVRLVDRLVSDRLVERRPGKDGREVALHLTAKGAASRKDLLSSRISAVASFLDVLSPSERKRLRELIRDVLARQDTSEMDRFTICRMCDNGVCSNCPLPTTVSKRDR